MTFMVYPYSSASAGAKDIAAALEGYRIKREGSSYKYSDQDVVINWGASNNPFPKALNADITSILSKKAFFDRVKYAGVAPRYALTQQAALALNCDLVCRQKDQGKDGEGIVVWLKQSGDPLPDAKLYVELVKKNREYRVHMGRNKDGQLVFIGQQRKFYSGDTVVWTGDQCKFVWTVDEVPITLPSNVANVARCTMDEFPELSFCGLDIVYDTGTDKAYVLEANSAPTMTPKSVMKYAAFFKGFKDG